MLNSNISSTCRHNIVNFSPLTAEIGSLVWGTPANFNRFCVFASLLHRRRSMEVNQILHDVWPSPGMVHCIYIFGGCCPLTEFCQVQNSICRDSFVNQARTPRYNENLQSRPLWAPKFPERKFADIFAQRHFNPSSRSAAIHPATNQRTTQVGHNNHQ